jgi:hypothetical protein
MNHGRAAIRFANADKRALRHIVLLFTTVSFITATAWLLHYSQKQNAARIDRAFTQNWRNVKAAAITPANLDAVATQWRMQRQTAGEQSALSWTTADARELKASLIALDSAANRALKISIMKRDTGFAANAELAP